MSAPAHALPVLLTREEAAALLAVSLRTFTRRVAGELPRVTIGTCVRYEREDVLRWLERQKAGPSTATLGPAPTPRGGASRVVAITAPRAREIAARLSGAQPSSTRAR